jgi:hypothetical protein
MLQHALLILAPSHTCADDEALKINNRSLFIQSDKQ